MGGSQAAYLDTGDHPTHPKVKEYPGHLGLCHSIIHRSGQQTNEDLQSRAWHRCPMEEF